MQTNNILLSAETMKLQMKVYKSLTKVAAKAYHADNKSPEAKVLGKALQQLGECSESLPCYNAACQNCLRITAQELQKTALKRVNELKLGQALQLTYLDPAWATPVGDLSSFDLSAVMESLKRSLSNKLPPKSLVVGGFDISHNLQLTSNKWLESQRWDEHYQPHFQLIAWGVTHQALKDALPPVKGKLLTGASSILIKSVSQDSLNQAMSYAFKNNFYRRISCPDPRHNPPLQKSLRGDEFKEVWSWLAVKKTKDLLVLKGVHTSGFLGITLNFQ